MVMAVTSTITLEIARLVARRPSPEQVIAFQPSAESVARAYALIEAERIGTLSTDEQQELESYLAMQHLMILAKAEAHQLLLQEAS
jgi:hypothetical protein